jgi:LuxR family quorum-sensing system transcriptional regulator SinR
MRGLDDIDLGALLQLETNLTDRTLNEFIEIIRNRYSLANVAYVCPGFAERGIADPFLALTYSDAWISHYRQEDCIFIDPVNRVGVGSLLPFDWARLPRENKKVQRLFDEARDGGVGTQGLTIPVRGPANGLWALFNVSSYDSEVDWAIRRHDLMKDMLHVAYYVHRLAVDLHAEEPLAGLDAITKREIEALQWAAAGLKQEEIAISMRIGVETVKVHLESARYKLRALNRVHAVAKAIRAGIIR